jgi:NADH dehydrogenase
MRHRDILIIGGSGFIGSALAARLVAQGRRVTVPTRRRNRARDLFLLPTIDVVEADVSDPKVLSTLVAGRDAVVSLVGILHGREGGAGDEIGPDFRRAHVELPAQIVAACREQGVKRLVHVSALGVTDTGEHTLPSRYLRSKAAGERVIREAPDIDWTILRPSVVFGPGDSFLTLFAKLQRFLPALALPRAEARFQPVFVGDVATAIAQALDEPATVRKAYELAGPRIYTLRQIVALAGKWSGHRRPVFGLPDGLGRLQALLMEYAPGPTLMSRDNLASMSIDNIASGPIAPELGVTPTSLEAIGPDYLGQRKPGGRHGAGRPPSRSDGGRDGSE